MKPAFRGKRRPSLLLAVAAAAALLLVVWWRAGTASVSSIHGGQSPVTAQGRSISSHAAVQQLRADVKCGDLFQQQQGLSTSLLYVEPGDVDVQLTLTQDSDDIMAWIAKNSVGERKVHELFRSIFRAGCPSNALFVDVGANAGFYGLLAAAYGCQVVLFEPQPLCVNLIQRNFCLNRRYPAIRERDINVIGRPVSVDTRPLAMSLPPLCRGSFSVVSGLPGVAGPRTNITVQPVSLDNIFVDSGADIFALKVDTEGFELSVLRTLRGMIAARRVQHMIIEVSPSVFVKDNIATREQVYAEFERFMDMQCTVQRVLVMSDGDAAAAKRFASKDELKSFLVHENFSIEDVYVHCPS